MSALGLFDGDRSRFFRPLNSSQRRLVAACLRVLYDRLHGPAADYSHNLTRDALKELLLPVVREQMDAPKLQAAEAPEADDILGQEEADPHAMVTGVIRALQGDGWLEQFADRDGLVTVFRFSRPGKLFSEALWSLDRPSRSRQRNMRGCRNALDAALLERGDAHDLVDAYEYAERVIQDLADATDYFQELIRNLMQEASEHSRWDEFVEFLERFQRDFAKQLTADNPALNRHAIRQNLEKLQAVPEAKLQRLELQLKDIAQWAVKECTGPSVYEWLLMRIADIVDAACVSKQPGFMKAMDSYMKRVYGLAQQSMMLRAGRTRRAHAEAVKAVASVKGDAQDLLLGRLGTELAAMELRLLDPARLRIKGATQRRKAVTVSIQPRPSREARLAAALRRAEAEAFAVPNQEIAELLRKELRLFEHPVRLSALATDTARGVLTAMQAVEAVRNDRGADLQVRRLANRLENDVYSGVDYEISFRKQQL